MRVAVVGGTGLIGARVVRRLQDDGHDVVAASRATGVNSFTGEGLAAALEGAHALIDVSNSSYTDERGAQEFFYGSTLNLLTYGAAAGVAHHIALSVVGTDRLAASQGGYFIAKAQQERLIRESGRPYTIVHGTQFFEFLRTIADDATHSGVAHVADVLIQPMAADDVAAAVATSLTEAPAGDIVEHAGPDVFELGDLLRREMTFLGDARQVVPDPLGRYFGAEVGRRDLLPAPSARLAPTHFADWQGTAR
ncbi:SDR family oxidoreductase [Microbacterium terrisoli]|uniref:SDR family oxidoreductase n=1 Tax=Microbacterium terrisoli TaxID=3242192 RepID=UPI0028044868|nr:NAD(P)H-binding protein [Microbacterium protaetiae]